MTLAHLGGHATQPAPAAARDLVNHRHSAARATDRRRCGSRAASQKPGSSLLDEVQPAHPFRALPEIQMRHQQPRRTAMLGIERLAFVTRGDHRLAADQVLDRHVGGVAAVAMGKHVRRRRLVKPAAASSVVDASRRCQCVSSFDHVVTQWMSTLISVCGSALNSSQLHSPSSDAAVLQREAPAGEVGFRASARPKARESRIPDAGPAARGRFARRGRARESRGKLEDHS